MPSPAGRSAPPPWCSPTALGPGRRCPGRRPVMGWRGSVHPSRLAPVPPARACSR